MNRKNPFLEQNCPTSYSVFLFRTVYILNKCLCQTTYITIWHPCTHITQLIISSLANEKLIILTAKPTASPLQTMSEDLARYKNCNEYLWRNAHLQCHTLISGIQDKKEHLYCIEKSESQMLNEKQVKYKGSKVFL